MLDHSVGEFAQLVVAWVDAIRSTTGFGRPVARFAPEPGPEFAVDDNPVALAEFLCDRYDRFDAQSGSNLAVEDLDGSYTSGYVSTSIQPLNSVSIAFADTDLGTELHIGHNEQLNGGVSLFGVSTIDAVSLEALLIDWWSPRTVWTMTETPTNGADKPLATLMNRHLRRSRNRPPAKGRWDRVVHSNWFRNESAIETLPDWVEQQPIHGGLRLDVSGHTAQATSTDRLVEDLTELSDLLVAAAQVDPGGHQRRLAESYEAADRIEGRHVFDATGPNRDERMVSVRWNSSAEIPHRFKAPVPSQLARQLRSVDSPGHLSWVTNSERIRDVAQSLEPALRVVVDSDPPVFETTAVAR